MMKKWVSFLLILGVLALFSYGCSGIARDTKIKSPKGGAIFTVDEAEIQKKRF